MGVHPMFFALPWLAAACRALNCIPAGDHRALEETMRAHSLVLLAPGGSYEMLKFGSKPQVLWREEPPFAQHATAQRWRVVPCATTNAELCVFNPLWYSGLHGLLRWLMKVARRCDNVYPQWCRYGMITPLVIVLCA